MAIRESVLQELTGVDEVAKRLVLFGVVTGAHLNKVLGYPNTNVLTAAQTMILQFLPKIAHFRGRNLEDEVRLNFFPGREAMAVGLLQSEYLKSTMLLYGLTGLKAQSEWLGRRWQRSDNAGLSEVTVSMQGTIGLLVDNGVLTPRQLQMFTMLCLLDQVPMGKVVTYQQVATMMGTSAEQIGKVLSRVENIEESNFLAGIFNFSERCPLAARVVTSKGRMRYQPQQAEILGKEGVGFVNSRTVHPGMILKWG